MPMPPLVIVYASGSKHGSQACPNMLLLKGPHAVGKYLLECNTWGHTWPDALPAEAGMMGWARWNPHGYVVFEKIVKNLLADLGRGAWRQGS